MLKIVLDPGHGKTTNRSPLDSSFAEGANNYLFALALKDALLEYEGTEVILTRNTIDEDPSLSSRGKMAVSTGADVFLSLHSNASVDSSAYGVEGFYSVKTPMAKGLLEGLCNVVRLNLPASKVRRVTTKLSGGEDYYGVLRASNGVPFSALIEMGFHTNPKELACIRLDEWHQVVAEGMAEVVSDFFKLEKKKAPVIEPVPDGDPVSLAAELEAMSVRLAEIAEILRK